MKIIVGFCKCGAEITVEDDSIVSEILKLFPEYEPVELEALGDEEIMSAVGLLSINYRKVSQATIRSNQEKFGKLFRLKDVSL